MEFPAWSRAVHAVGNGIMQRWIVAGVVAVLLFCGMGVGGLFAYRAYKQNLPAPIWVPMPINPELPNDKRDEILNKLKTELEKPELLAKVSHDVGLVKKWELPTDEACAAELGRRMFVRAGEMDTPMGKVPAIHVGLAGKRKEREVSGEIAMRLMDDVWKILGIEPPKHQEQ
jgi:hypothetical protein